MKKTSIFILIAIFFIVGISCNIIIDDEPEPINIPDYITELKNFGGIYSDIVYDLIETPDGGYYMNIRWDDDEDPYYRGMKLDSNYQIEWQTDFPADYDTAEIFSTKVTSDGGFILAGSHNDVPSEESTSIIFKLSSDGFVEWTKKLPNNSYDDSFFDVMEKDTGGYIAVGHNNHVGYFVEFDTSGNILSEETINGFGTIIMVEEDGYISLNSSSSKSIKYYDYGREFPLENTTIKKTSFDENTLWECTDDGSNEKIVSIQKTSDSGYLLSGYSTDPYTSRDPFKVKSRAYMAKINPTGNIEWEKEIKRTDEDTKDKFNSVAETDSGYIAVGRAYLYGEYPSDDTDAFYFAEIDKSGNLEWKETIWANGLDKAKSVVHLNDERFLIVGETYSTNIPDILIEKLSTELGDVIHEDIILMETDFSLR